MGLLSLERFRTLPLGQSTLPLSLQSIQPAPRQRDPHRFVQQLSSEGVEFPDGIIVTLAFNGQSVLSTRKLVLELEEGLVRFALRIGLAQHQ